MRWSLLGLRNMLVSSDCIRIWFFNFAFISRSAKLVQSAASTTKIDVGIVFVIWAKLPRTFQPPCRSTPWTKWGINWFRYRYWPTLPSLLMLWRPQKSLEVITSKKRFVLKSPRTFRRPCRSTPWTKWAINWFRYRYWPTLPSVFLLWWPQKSFRGCIKQNVLIAKPPGTFRLPLKVDTVNQMGYKLAQI